MDFGESIFMVEESVPHCITCLPHILLSAMHAGEGVDHPTGRAGERGVYGI